LTIKLESPKRSLDRNDKVQLLLYQEAARQVLDKIPVKLTYYYLENGSRLSFIGSDKDVQKKKRSLPTMQKIFSRVILKQLRDGSARLATLTLSVNLKTKICSIIITNNYKFNQYV